MARISCTAVRASNTSSQERHISHELGLNWAMHSGTPYRDPLRRGHNRKNLSRVATVSFACTF